MSLTLTRQSVTDQAAVGNQHVWPLGVTAVSTTDGLASEIFVYHAAMGDDPVNSLDLFECVASLPQMYEIGLSPILHEGEYSVPYYRSSIATFACRSAEDADSLWVKIQDDATDLHNNFNYFESLSTEETVVIS